MFLGSVNLVLNPPAACQTCRAVLSLLEAVVMHGRVKEWELERAGDVRHACRPCGDSSSIGHCGRHLVGQQPYA